MQLPLNLRELVGDEDVGRLDQPREHALPGVRGDVERDAALVPVEDLGEVVDAVPAGHHAGRDDLPVGVAVKPLDLDHVGAVLGEDRRGRRHEPVLGHVDDADALERETHGWHRCLQSVKVFK
jgi:hypothetical protein